jgi:hypothetical protein
MSVSFVFIPNMIAANILPMELTQLRSFYAMARAHCVTGGDALWAGPTGPELAIKALGLTSS